MNVLLVPPHADFTLEWPVPEGFRRVDVARDFVRRALSPASLSAAATAREAGAKEGGEGARSLLLLRVASALLESAGSGDVHRHLRACGAALAGLSTPPCPVRLRLDDLELPDGTTERSEDVLRAASASGAPWAEDLERAIAECAGAEVVRLRLDCDQQLPAAAAVLAALARASGGRHRVEVTGAFAAAHWEALSRLEPFAGAALVTVARGESPPCVAGSPLLLRAEGELRWVDEPYRMRVPPGGPWGGAVPFGALAEPRTLIASGCRVVVVGFGALGDAEAVGADGAVLGRDALRAAGDALRGAGVRLVGEWWVGAPGVGEGELGATLRVLEEDPPFDWLAGVRPFHWPVWREGGRWGRVEVAPGPVPEGRDLARSRPFSAAGTERASEKLEPLAQRLARRAPLSPGRMAQAYAASPAPRPPPGERVCLDPDCAIVTLPASLDGKPGPAAYATNLRTGLLMAMDPRLAPSLERLRAPAMPTEALPRVPEAQRAKLVRALVEKAVLMEVGA